MGFSCNIRFDKLCSDLLDSLLTLRLCHDADDADDVFLCTLRHRLVPACESQLCSDLLDSLLLLRLCHDADDADDVFLCTLSHCLVPACVYELFFYVSLANVLICNSVASRLAPVKINEMLLNLILSIWPIQIRMSKQLVQHIKHGF